MDIKYSRRLLAVGAPNSATLNVIRDLTGTTPTPHENGSTAGLSHEWNVETAYYKAKVPIWIDEISDVEVWKADFLKSEAKEVVEAVGAWVYCFRSSDGGDLSKEVEDTMEAIQEVSEEHAGYGADAVMLAVAIPSAVSSKERKDDHAEMEDVCMQYGFEYIDYPAQGKNEFGEKVGFGRLKEALESNEWASADLSDEDDLLAGDLDEVEDDMHGFARDEAEMTAELFGMKAALAGNDFEPDAEEFVPPTHQANQVEDLDRMMGKLLAVKEQSADLPEAQRKRLAANAVRELMDA